MQILIKFLKNSRATTINCLFLLFCFVFFACKNNSVDTPQVLVGSWVETMGKGDTLIFKTNTTFVEVKRGIEIKNGIRLPKIGSGLWQYNLLKEYKMEVHYALSSNSASTISHVEFKDDILYVANFYELETPNKYELREFSRK